MRLIVCLDDRNGMSFSGRRLSSDQEVCRHILGWIGDSKLQMDASSAKLFPDGSVCIREDIFEKAGEDIWVFWETAPIPMQLPDVQEIVIYRWNRHYPATQTFPTNLLDGLRLAQTQEFPGNSHEKITMQRYTL